MQARSLLEEAAWQPKREAMNEMFTKYPFYADG